MSRTWFTSDLHLGHPRVAELRGFETVEEHDRTIMEGWRQQVADEEVVWVLGDIAVQDPMRALDLIASLPGRKRLVAGNHDPVHPLRRSKVVRQHFDAFADVFEVVSTAATTRIGDTEVLLSHFPYTRDRGETRYLQWRLPDMGATLLHGHLHDTSRLVGHEVHVGLDAWCLQLVSDRQVADLLQVKL